MFNYSFIIVSNYLYLLFFSFRSLVNFITFKSPSILSTICQIHYWYIHQATYTHIEYPSTWRTVFHPLGWQQHSTPQLDNNKIVYLVLAESDYENWLQLLFCGAHRATETACADWVVVWHVKCKKGSSSCSAQNLHISHFLYLISKINCNQVSRTWGEVATMSPVVEAYCRQKKPHDFALHYTQIEYLNNRKILKTCNAKANVKTKPKARQMH